MKSEPNTGFGTCRLEATTKVVAPLSWITEGRELQYAATVLAAVHDHNRKAGPDAFIALDFPDATFRREFAGKPGTSARLIGSRTALAVILESGRLRQFRRRTITDVQNLISVLDKVEEGYCIARSRRTEKLQPGTIRRRIRRAERAGLDAGHIEKLGMQLRTSLSMTAEERRRAIKAPFEAAVFLGEQPFFMSREKAKACGDTGLVSTYGMSSPDKPVIFGKWIEDRDASSPGARKVDSDILAGLCEEEEFV